MFAFSGYMLLQLQHFGLVCGYAWMPLGFSSIDAVDRECSWRSLWKLAVASAMCFLAGYPPTWVVFAVSMIAYACGRKNALRCAPRTAAALAASLCLSSIQLLPAWEAARVKVPEERYNRASGITDPEFFISYFVPNYFDFGLDVPLHTNPGREYLYLGAAAFAGLGFLLWCRRFSGIAPMLAVLLSSIMFLTNPFAAPAGVIEHSSLLAQVFSDWYFLAGLTAAAAPLAALGLDSAVTRKSRPAPRWLETAAITISLAWTLRLIAVWIGGGRFAIGWLSGVDALIASALLGALIVIFPGSTGRRRAVIAVTALILPATDYKAFGTSKRFNANRGPYSANYAALPFPGLDAPVYEALRSHLEYRVALDLTGPFAVNLRHLGLVTHKDSIPCFPRSTKP